MYWVNRKIVSSVLRNPFNPTELMKKAKANQIFTDIYNEYMDEYENTWTRGSMPLNYFVKKFGDKTGSNKKNIENSFIDYIEKHTVIRKVD